nr:MAG TPA: hypothetical protein [Caudoviricetes sp.]
MLYMHEAIHHHRDGTVTVRRWFSPTKGKPRRKRRDNHRIPSISPRISSNTGTSRSTTRSMSSAVHGGTQPSFRLALLTKSRICLRSASASVKVTAPFPR